MAEIEIPFGHEAETALKNFNKRAIGAIAPHFHKGLATATEPFFRCNHGPALLDRRLAGHGDCLMAGGRRVMHPRRDAGGGSGGPAGLGEAGALSLPGEQGVRWHRLGVAALFAFLGQWTAPTPASASLPACPATP